MLLWLIQPKEMLDNLKNLILGQKTKPTPPTLAQVLMPRSPTKSPLTQQGPERSPLPHSPATPDAYYHHHQKYNDNREEERQMHYHYTYMLSDQTDCELTHLQSNATTESNTQPDSALNTAAHTPNRSSSSSPQRTPQNTSSTQLRSLNEHQQKQSEFSSRVHRAHIGSPYTTSLKNEEDDARIPTLNQLLISDPPTHRKSLSYSSFPEKVLVHAPTLDCVNSAPSPRTIRQQSTPLILQGGIHLDPLRSINTAAVVRSLDNANSVKNRTPSKNRTPEMPKRPPPSKPRTPQMQRGSAPFSQSSHSPHQLPRPSQSFQLSRLPTQLPKHGKNPQHEKRDHEEVAVQQVQLQQNRNRIRAQKERLSQPFIRALKFQQETAKVEQ